MGIDSTFQRENPDRASFVHFGFNYFREEDLCLSATRMRVDQDLLMDIVEQINPRECFSVYEIAASLRLSTPEKWDGFSMKKKSIYEMVNLKKDLNFCKNFVLYVNMNNFTSGMRYVVAILRKGFDTLSPVKFMVWHTDYGRVLLFLTV